MTTRSEKIKTKVTALLSQTNPALTHRQIAEMGGCSKKTVQRIAHSVQPELEEIQPKLEEYRGRLRRELPIDARVQVLKEVAEQTAHPIARLKAVLRADEIDGLRIPGEEQQSNQPMFVFADGPVKVEVNSMLPEQRTRNYALDKPA